MWILDFITNNNWQILFLILSIPTFICIFIIINKVRSISIKDILTIKLNENSKSEKFSSIYKEMTGEELDLFLRVGGTNGDRATYIDGSFEYGKWKEMLYNLHKFGLLEYPEPAKSKSVGEGLKIENTQLGREFHREILKAITS